MSNTQRSLKWLRDRGFHAERCEQWRPSHGQAQAERFAGGHRKDLFGFGDLLAFHTAFPHAILVQVTSRQQITAHLRKMRRDPTIRAAALAWLKYPQARSICVHGWERVNVACKTKAGTVARWQLTVKWLQASDLEP